MKTNVHFWSYLSQFFSEDKSFMENQNSHFKFSNFYFQNRAVFYINVKKYFRTGQTADDNVVHGHFMLDT